MGASSIMVYKKGQATKIKAKTVSHLSYAFSHARTAQGWFQMCWRWPHNST